VIFCTTDPNNKDRPAGSDSGDDWLNDHEAHLAFGSTNHGVF
jgi:hypothetical protein